MTYLISKEAESDLVEIYLYGDESFGTEAAERYVSDLLHVFDLIAANPRIARERREFKPPMRLHPHKAHIIFYDLDEIERPIIRRVVAARTNWTEALF